MTECDVYHGLGKEAEDTERINVGVGVQGQIVADAIFVFNNEEMKVGLQRF
jgi:hypothetical protein